MNYGKKQLCLFPAITQFNTKHYKKITINILLTLLRLTGYKIAFTVSNSDRTNFQNGASSSEKGRVRKRRIQ